MVSLDKLIVVVLSYNFNMQEVELQQSQVWE